MIRKRFIRSSAILMSSIASLIPHGPGKASDADKYSKKLRESVLVHPGLAPASSTTGVSDPPNQKQTPTLPKQQYPWRNSIVTTTFWIGEKAAPKNPIPNHKSSWDTAWAQNYGGTDTPDRSKRANYMPAAFTPKQNPFYVALPYNDLMKGGHKPEAAAVIPWFHKEYKGKFKSVLKGRWVAIRYKDKIAYAQWEDCGPFRTDHWQYVFGNERPKPNLNRGAGLDVSPAVRDFLGMADTDVTDWRFVEFEEVPHGPWATHGDNNTFVINQRAQDLRVAAAKGATEATQELLRRAGAPASPLHPTLIPIPSILPAPLQQLQIAEEKRKQAAAVDKDTPKAFIEPEGIKPATPEADSPAE